MKQNRRTFIKNTLAGSAALALSPLVARAEPIAGPVTLGNTGIKISRVAMGTGTHGSEQHSKQTRLGKTGFIDLAQHCHDNGVRLLDAADSYGSHPFIKETLREIDRDKVKILTKLWTRPCDWDTFTTAQKAVDRYRKEMDTDYLDIVLIHCMVYPDWPQRYAKVMEQLAALKEKGVIGSYGVSCHSVYALQAAIEHDWTEVILARFNNNGTLMDHKPEVIKPMLQQARKKGKGIIGMKVFGGGKTTLEAERQSSLEYVLNSDAVDAVTLGFGSTAEANDAFERIRKIIV